MARGQVEIETLIAKDTVEFKVVNLKNKLAWQEKGQFGVDFGRNGRRSLSVFSTELKWEKNLSNDA